MGIRHDVQGANECAHSFSMTCALFNLRGGGRMPGWWSLCANSKHVTWKSQTWMLSAQEACAYWVTSPSGQVFCIFQLRWSDRLPALPRGAGFGHRIPGGGGASLELLLGFCVNTKCYFWLTGCFLRSKKEGKTLFRLHASVKILLGRYLWYFHFLL